MFEVNISDDEDTLTLSSQMLECCIDYCHLEHHTYFVSVNALDGRLTFTIR